MKQTIQRQRRWEDGLLRVFLTVLALGCILWLGGTVYRAVIANEFFVPGTLKFEPGINPSQERMLFQLIAASSALILASWLLVLVSAIVVLRRIPLRMKDNGWLLMAAILYFIFVPAELFTAWLDVNFILEWFEAKAAYIAGGPDSYDAFRTALRSTLAHRIGALHGLPVMATLSYFTAVVVIVLQPMKRGNNANEPD